MLPVERIQDVISRVESELYSLSNLLHEEVCLLAVLVCVSFKLGYREYIAFHEGSVAGAGRLDGIVREVDVIVQLVEGVLVGRQPHVRLPLLFDLTGRRTAPSGASCRRRLGCRTCSLCRASAAPCTSG